jgi:adenylate kinase family enzyme
MKGYNVVCQAVINDQKQFTNIFVGFPRSVNDFRMFRSLIYYFAQFQGLFSVDKGQEGFSPLFC